MRRAGCNDSDKRETVERRHATLSTKLGLVGRKYNATANDGFENPGVADGFWRDRHQVAIQQHEIGEHARL